MRQDLRGGGGKKLASLAPLLLECPGELEADFQQFYGLDLFALLDEGRWRRAASLAAQLPRESRTVARQDPRARWGDAEYLLALAVDNLAFMRYERTGKGRKPKPVERPRKRAAKRQAERTVHGMSAARVGEILSRPRA